MSNLNQVVLIGAAGTVGSSILKALLSDTAFQITILTRPDSTSVFPESTRITIARCEYTTPNLISTFQDHDAVICVNSVQSLSIQRTIMEAAEKAGVKRFILNDYGNSIVTQTGLPELERFRTTKREDLEHAKQLSATNPSFTWSALATGNFIDYSLRKYPAFGFNIPQRKARLIDGGEEHFGAVTLEDIGIGVRGMLRRPEETANKYLHIRSTETTQKEILKALEEITGKEWEVEYADSKELYKKGQEMLEKGDRQWMLNLLVFQLFQKGGGRSVVISKEDSNNELLGVKEKKVNEIVKEVLDTWEA